MDSSILGVIEAFLPGLKAVAAWTENKTDDLVVRVVEVILGDPDLRELFETWFNGRLGAESLGTEALREAVKADADTVRLAQQVADKTGMDWEVIIELIVKYLPVIIEWWRNRKQTS